MGKKLTKIICLVMFFAVILVVGASPVSADTSMSSITDCHTDQETTAVPLCCLNSACLVAHNINVNLALPDGRFSLNSNKYTISQLASIINPTLLANNTKPFDTGPGQDTSQFGAVFYRCRNCLTQEEPPLY